MDFTLHTFNIVRGIIVFALLAWVLVQVVLAVYKKKNGYPNRRIAIIFLFLAFIVNYGFTKAGNVLFPIDLDAFLKEKEPFSAYLMTYFKDEDHSLHMALSADGYTFTDINGGKAIIGGDTIATQKGIRDPHIYRGPDGAFYLAMTDLHIFGKREGYRDTEWERDGELYSWGNNQGFVLMKSKDLIHWSRANVMLNDYPGFENIGCAWAPETIYDEQEQKLMLYFTTRFGNGINVMYYAYVNDDYNKLISEPKLLLKYPKELNTIDADITYAHGKYHMFFTPHDNGAGVKYAVSDKINADYLCLPDWVDREEAACEAPTVWKRNGGEKWVLMYDIFGINPHNFGFMETTDFKTFTDLGRFNEGVMKTTNFTSPKHGSVISLTRSEAQKLATHWGLDMRFPRR